MGGTDDEWPSFTANVDSARLLSRNAPEVERRITDRRDDTLTSQVEALSEKLRDLTATVEHRTIEAAAPANPELEKDVHWMKVRVMGLEQALEESRSETKTLIEYLELCFDVLKSTDDRLTERQEALRREIDRLLGHSGTVDRDLIDLRAKQNVANERTELLAIELLELTHQTTLLASEAQESANLTAEESEQLARELREANAVAQRLAAQAQESASMTASESDQLAKELRDAVEAAQDLASQAQQTATMTADGSEQLALELREANKTSQDLAALAKQTAELTAEEAEQIAHELREANKVAQELAAKAKETAELTAEEAQQTAKELRDANEEARVMAEKAKDRADFSADTVAGLQVDFEEETSSLRKHLKETTGSLSETSTRIDKLEERDENTSPEVYASELREQIERELRSLREKMDDPIVSSENQAEPVKRWRYHLPEEPKTNKALPSATKSESDPVEQP